MTLSLKRTYSIIKGVLILFPIATLFYIWSGALHASQNLSDLLGSNPALALAFLVAMLQPFVVLILKMANDDCDRGKGLWSLVLLALLLIAEGMMRNLPGMIGLALLFYLTFRQLPIPAFPEVLTNLRDKALLRQIVPSILLILFSGFCLFITLRLSLIV